VPIDFQDPANRRTYSDREADPSWHDAVAGIVDPAGAAVVDVGCGGGTYSRAWSALGAATVVGVDSSAPILTEARRSHGNLPGVTFRSGTATDTGLPDASADVVFARALIHHLPDLRAFAAEAARLLRPGGVLLVQDRTPDDVRQPGGVDHPRGWLFEVHPQLLAVEDSRRLTSEAVTVALSGWHDVTATSLWEVRRRYASRDDYLAEIRSRTGRSILHELDDGELDQLVGALCRRLPAGPLVEQDRWTFWAARRPRG
jgi:SAM-dependent methyltransferase